ncbi:hypothetical protein BUALT_Bualt06G0091900 [Buddleja alternifolia]|uniref:Reverse transcriptase domain-containing protein n=1 Tax=Buddleja alternifolia TaxID=168488 RepID=A0AAV6XF79_9LAMI|nr:hypothetical protein BUALT_Bualt06G0091900 [Buddleja alternifolia]
MRLKHMMEEIVSPMQSSIIPHRSTRGNILILQEMVHSLRHSKNRKGGMILKIDLEKAYHNVNWDFLQQTLNFFGFLDSLTKLIVFCVTCSQPSILGNREPLPHISPTCGLRQGDSLSPYLFALCTERLAYLIKEEVSRGDWNPIGVCRGGPMFSYLFFADDLLFMAQASFLNVASIH